MKTANWKVAGKIATLNLPLFSINISCDDENGWRVDEPEFLRKRMSGCMFDTLEAIQNACIEGVGLEWGDCLASLPSKTLIPRPIETYLPHFPPLGPKEPWTNQAENPKESAGRKKCPMHLLSPSAMRETANALGSGAAKYGVRNYRTAGVNATTYVAAILRHITAWNDGEDNDSESGLSHIAHVAACCDILLDTQACGMLNDDRSKKP